MDDLAGRLTRAKREALGISQRRLGERVGFSDARITQLERGHPWHLQNLQALAGALGCDPVELLDGEWLTGQERELLSAFRSGDLKALMRIAMGALDK